MKPLLSALNDIPEYRSLLAAIDNGACPAAFSGLSAVHRAHFAAGIRQELGRPVVVVCADEGEAERMARDLAALSGEEVRTLSAREFTFHNAAVVSRQYEHRRLSTLRALAAGECPLLVCTVESILQRTIPKTLLTQAAQVLRDGVVVDYTGALRIVRSLKEKLEARLGTELVNCAIAMPAGTESSVKTHQYVAEGAGLEVTNILDEPSAANAIYQIEDGVVVDIGGGTTGLAIGGADRG